MSLSCLLYCSLLSCVLRQKAVTHQSQFQAMPYCIGNKASTRSSGPRGAVGCVCGFSICTLNRSECPQGLGQRSSLGLGHFPLTSRIPLPLPLCHSSLSFRNGDKKKTGPKNRPKTLLNGDRVKKKKLFFTWGWVGWAKLAL